MLGTPEAGFCLIKVTSSPLPAPPGRSKHLSPLLIQVSLIMLRTWLTVSPRVSSLESLLGLSPQALQSGTGSNKERVAGWGWRVSGWEIAESTLECGLLQGSPGADVALTVTMARSTSSCHSPGGSTWSEAGAWHCKLRDATNPALPARTLPPLPPIEAFGEPGSRGQEITHQGPIRYP